MPNRSKKRPTPRIAALKIVKRDGSIRPPRAARGSGGPRRPTFPLIVEFGRGSSTPNIDSVAALHRCGQWLAKRGTERVSVVGHANKRISEKAATKLARARVAAVTNLLLLFGASSAQIVAVATPRLHSMWGRLTPLERLQRRVVVIFRHEPPRARQRQAPRPARSNGTRQALRKRTAVR